MVDEALAKLAQIVTVVPPLLKKISAEEFAYKVAEDKWSKKEILGHLIDSATNNHQRFIRAQYEMYPDIAYDQNKWNTFNHHQELDIVHLIDFWTMYNTHLVEVIKRIPSESLHLTISVNGETFTLAFIICDYVAHLQHHLNQIIEEGMQC